MGRGGWRVEEGVVAVQRPCGTESGVKGRLGRGLGVRPCQLGGTLATSLRIPRENFSHIPGTSQALSPVE